MVLSLVFTVKIQADAQSAHDGAARQNVQDQQHGGRDPSSRWGPTDDTKRLRTFPNSNATGLCPRAGPGAPLPTAYLAERVGVGGRVSGEALKVLYRGPGVWARRAEGGEAASAASPAIIKSLAAGVAVRRW
jgi:hypothetical protein